MSAGANSGHTPRWGMVVDVNRCVGCQTCTIACKHANDMPPGVEWRRVIDVERGAFPDVERLFMVVGCQHCAEPSCVPVCPTGATRQRADGLVTMDYDRCIGCGYCAVACPYQARTIVHDKEWYYGEPTVQEEKVWHDERLGVANKCTFCMDRVDAGMANGQTPGVDLGVTPACAASCIASAIHFGDFADPGSNVSKLASDNAYFQMHAELGNDPQIKYLYEVPNATPGRDPDPEELSDDVMGDPANPLVGSRQTFWDFRAAMNFTMGGMSTGLVLAAYLSFMLGDGRGAGFFPSLTAKDVLPFYFAGGVGMAIGLFFVFLEIGRKLRFIYVLLRPQSSWMTRETYAVAAFYPALLADLIWPNAWLHTLVAVAAAGFLYCQGRILHAAKGIPAWRSPFIPWMLTATGLYEGAGLLMLLLFVFKGSFDAVVVAIFGLLLLAPVNAALWHAYRRTAKARGMPPLARREINRITPFVHLIGHALPIALLAWAYFELPGGGLDEPWVLGAAGLAAVAGGVLWKFWVITRACYEQGYALPKMPQRGSGKRAAPARLGAV